MKGYNKIVNQNNLNSFRILEIVDNHIKFQKKTPDSHNLIKIFYHELIVYASNFYIIKKSPFKNNSPVRFPFLNSNYVNNTKKIKIKKIEKKINFLNYLKIGIGKKLFMTNLLSLSKIEKILFATKYKVHFISNTKISLPNIEEQILDLNILLKKIMKFLNIKNNNFSHNFVKYIMRFISKKKDYQSFKTKNSVLIVGTNMNINNRLVSANFLQEKTNKVISINHANYPFYIYNEPIRQIEYSFCTDYISFGNYDFSKKLKKSVFNLPKFHFISSSQLENIYIRKKINKINFFKNPKYLYVSNQFNTNHRYGPFRDMDDEIYYNFQKNLLSTFKNIDIKNHPKNFINYFKTKPILSRKNFNQILHRYDVYIFDYFSTAFSTAIATNKPIIYFDIGLRNLEKNVLNLIKKRVHYFKINLDKSFSEQIEKSLLSIKKNNNIKKNLFTQKYSLNNKNKNINKLIDKII